MDKGRSSTSRSGSYHEIGEFWDTHDLSDYWDQTGPADFDVEIRSSAVYFPVESNLAARLTSVAGQRGVSAETLQNRRVQEKNAADKAPG